MRKNKTLINYIISSHVDKKMTSGQWTNSKYDCPMQAGAALTDKRICPINDWDDCNDSISDQNRRYCEATAMWWIYRHLNTSYVGIMHYRRRLLLNDIQFDEYMDEDVDIITSYPDVLNCSIDEQYRELLYTYDWELFLEILHRKDPNNFAFYRDCLQQNLMHTCNVNVFKSELYKELCEWAFPICKEFSKLAKEKTDVYQHRDTAFIMERLSHLFIMKKYAEGKNIKEAELVKLESSEWTAEEECNYNDPDDIFNACNRLYKIHQITRCKYVLGTALRYGWETDKRLRSTAELLAASIQERESLPETMHEYLPTEYRTDLNILIPIWDGFKKISYLRAHNTNDLIEETYNSYLDMTHFSQIACQVALASS